MFINCAARIGPKIKKKAEFTEIRILYFNNNIGLLIYSRRGVLVIYEIINSRDF